MGSTEEKRDILVIIKLGVTGFIATLTNFWGLVGWVIVFAILTMGIDMLTGYAYALKMGTWKSEIAHKGTYKKLGNLFVIAVCLLLDSLIYIISHSTEAFQLPGWYQFFITISGCTWVILTELGSIIENAGLLGANVPKFLVKAIEVLKKRSEAKADIFDDGEKEITTNSENIDNEEIEK